MKLPRRKFLTLSALAPVAAWLGWPKKAAADVPTFNAGRFTESIIAKQTASARCSAAFAVPAVDAHKYEDAMHAGESFTFKQVSNGPCGCVALIPGMRIVSIDTYYPGDKAYIHLEKVMTPSEHPQSYCPECGIGV